MEWNRDSQTFVLQHHFETAFLCNPWWIW